MKSRGDPRRSSNERSAANPLAIIDILSMRKVRDLWSIKVLASACLLISAVWSTAACVGLKPNIDDLRLGSVSVDERFYPNDAPGQTGRLRQVEYLENLQDFQTWASRDATCSYAAEKNPRSLSPTDFYIDVILPQQVARSQVNNYPIYSEIDVECVRQSFSENVINDYAVSNDPISMYAVGLAYFSSGCEFKDSALHNLITSYEVMERNYPRYKVYLSSALYAAAVVVHFCADDRSSSWDLRRRAHDAGYLWALPPRY